MASAVTLRRLRTGLGLACAAAFVKNAPWKSKTTGRTLPADPLATVPAQGSAPRLPASGTLAASSG